MYSTVLMAVCVFGQRKVIEAAFKEISSAFVGFNVIRFQLNAIFTLFAFQFLQA